MMKGATFRVVIAIGLLGMVALLTQSSAIAGPATIQVGDIWFCDETFEDGVCETTINPGDTVIWDFNDTNLPHTTTACGDSCDDPTVSPLWDSGLLNDGTFEYTFNEPGTYLYYCQVHPTLQRGTIIVQGAATPAPTPTPTPEGLLGDANCSGGVDAIDAALVLQLTAGLVYTLSCQENADANEDGSLNAIDAALILQLTAGLIETLPA